MSDKKEYIEREAVINAILGQPPEPHYPEWYYRDVKDIPAADVAPVVHGEWIPYYENVEIYNTGGFKERKQTGWICSRCKSKKSYTPYGNENYCPNCGAKMDGGRRCVTEL